MNNHAGLDYACLMFTFAMNGEPLNWNMETKNCNENQHKKCFILLTRSKSTLEKCPSISCSKCSEIAAYRRRNVLELGIPQVNDRVRTLQTNNGDRTIWIMCMCLQRCRTSAVFCKSTGVDWL